MAVRETEKRLPFKIPFDPASGNVDIDDLGQATWDARRICCLVSFLTSPLSTTSKNDYIVFVTNGINIDNYHWRIEQEADKPGNPAILVTEQDTKVGAFSWQFDHDGTYTIHVYASSATYNSNISLKQHVIQSLDNRETMAYFQTELNGISNEFGYPFFSGGHVAAIYGEWWTTDQLLNDYWVYIFEAANQTNANPTADETNEKGIPARLLASVIYHQMLTAPAKGKDDIENAAKELDDSSPTGSIETVSQRLGVAQIQGQIAAMFFRALLLSDDWKELPNDAKQRKKIEQQMRDDYKNLVRNQRDIAVDIFNHLRFPKTNVALAAKLLAKLKNRSHRYPMLTQKALLGDENALKILATEFLSGPVETASVDFKPSADSGKIYKGMNALYLRPYFTEHRYFPASYKTVELKRGNITSEVLALKNDLKELGFMLVVDDDSAAMPNNNFNAHTEWAVREFQIYSKMPFIACELATANPAIDPITQRLRQVLNLYRYRGPINGVVNKETAKRIQAWKAHKWRCPVIISAWTWNTVTNTRNALAQTSLLQRAENIWLARTVDSTKPRIFAQDYTDYYTVPNNRREGGSTIFQNGFIVIGEFTKAPILGPNFQGPVSHPPRETWWHDTPRVTHDTEILPENLVGETLYLGAGPLTAEQKAKISTFKVIRAVAEQECEGYYDVITAWDDAFISVGAIHWTLKGELGAFLSYLRTQDYSAFEKALGFFDIDVAKDWGTDGSDLLVAGRKYESKLKIMDSNGKLIDLDLGGMADPDSPGNWFRSWHWFYRFQMAARTIPGFQHWMWAMIRRRLFDICSTPFPSGIAWPGGPIPSIMGRNPTISEVYTSEQAIGLLLRWHVKRPGHVCGGAINNPEVGARLQNAFTKAIAKNAFIIDPQNNPGLWTKDHELALIEGIMDEFSSDNMDKVRDWPTWSAAANPNNFLLDPGRLDPASRRLNAERNSFKMSRLTGNDH